MINFYFPREWEFQQVRDWLGLRGLPGWDWIVVNERKSSPWHVRYVADWWNRFNEFAIYSVWR